MNGGFFTLVIILIFGGLITMLMPKVTAGFKHQQQAKPARETA